MNTHTQLLIWQKCKQFELLMEQAAKRIAIIYNRFHFNQLTAEEKMQINSREIIRSPGTRIYFWMSWALIAYFRFIPLLLLWTMIESETAHFEKCNVQMMWMATCVCKKGNQLRKNRIDGWPQKLEWIWIFWYIDRKKLCMQTT